MKALIQDFVDKAGLIIEDKENLKALKDLQQI